MSTGLRVPVAVGLRGTEPGFCGMVGQHASMHRLFEVMRLAAPLDVPVLVQGPTGSGKELVAQGIHDLSGRRGAMVPVNVGTLPEQLAESELFGAARGAFTGAVTERAGLIESARGGTLFLDEAAELSHATQVRLLRVLETGVVRLVGGIGGRHVDFRLVLCMQEPAADLVASKRWREDFYYRVAGIMLTVPALSQRTSDIRLLTDHWLARVGRPPLPVCEDGLLESRIWRGNVRELRRAVERACFVVGEARVTAQDVLDAADSLQARPSPLPDYGSPLSLAALEREHIERVLKDCGYQTRVAARQLGISAGQLYRKYRALGIAPPRAR
jgi:two-component system response regulator HydG